MIKWEYRLNEGELKDQSLETNTFISGFGKRTKGEFANAPFEKSCRTLRALEL